MKKLFLSLVAAIVAASATFAQTTMVVTLSHGTDVSMFYGSYALRAAMNAAVSGDVINLSGGGFQTIEINKAVTLRGAGIDAVDPTYIMNDITINIPTEDTGRLSLEGIRCTGTIYFKGSLNNPYFLKCQFKGFYFEDNSAVKNVMLADSKVTDFISVYGQNSIQFVNCFISGFSNNSPETSSASFVNCVIYPVGGNCPENIRSSQLVNCIIYSTGYTLPNTSIATNCVSIGNDGLFNDLQSKSNCKLSTYEEMFKNFTGTYSDDQTFELTDAAKAKFLGTDGSEVGMYGGLMPYSSTPSYPQITKMNVSKKTTADGKLSVDIEVSAVQ